MKNLERIANWFNPMQATTNKRESFELDNIVIYSENGILIETGRGWFDNGNNEIKDGLEIKPEIVKKIKIDFNCKQNFVARSEQKEYRFDRKYTLYLYYKNINYKFEGLTLDSLFLNLNYSILNNYKNYIVIGDRRKKSDSIQYSNKLEENLKKIDLYHFDFKPEEFKKALKEIAKIHKEFEKVKEAEKLLTVNDYQSLIRDSAKTMLENNKKI